RTSARWYRKVRVRPASSLSGAANRRKGVPRRPRGGYASGLTSRCREPGSSHRGCTAASLASARPGSSRAWAESSRAAGGRGGGTMATKRLRLLSLMAVGVLALGACSSTPSASGGGGSADACAGTGTQGGANLQIPDVEQGKFNVAMVLIGPHDDGGWSQAHYEGLQYLCKNMEGSHVAYIENVPEGADSEQVFRSLSRKGFNFIIGTSFGYMDPMATVAEEFPDITYLHLTG